MSEEERELTKTEEWFRDRLNDYLGYGAAVFAILAGWLISSDSSISLAHDADADKREAAVVLCVFVPLAWAVWYLVLLRTHARCPPHPTVIKRRSLHLYALGMALGLAVILFLVVDNLLPALGAG
jgi:hypothetical protein